VNLSNFIADDPNPQYSRLDRMDGLGAVPTPGDPFIYKGEPWTVTASWANPPALIITNGDVSKTVWHR